MKKIADIVIKHRHILVLIVLVFASVACQMYQINRDYNGLHEYNNAHEALMAKNILKFGSAAKYGPVINRNPLNGKFTYYLYHPFLAVYVEAALFRVFGSSFTATRLMAISISVIGALGLFLLISTLWSKQIALWTCFFYLFFPVSQYFGKSVGGGQQLLLFMYMFLLFYYLWVREKKRSYFYLTAGFFALACATDWFAYFLAPITIIHYRYILKIKKPQIFLLLYICAFFVIAYLAVNYFLTGSFMALQPQWPANIADNLGVDNQGFIHHALTTRMDFTLLLQSSYYITILDYLLNSFTLPVILLVSYFLFNYKTYKYFNGPTVYMLFIGALYFAYGLLNPKTLSDHIFWTLYLSATFAAICALVISKASRSFQLIFIVVFLIFSAIGARTLYSMNNTNQNDLMLGKVIAGISRPNDGIALTETFYSPFIEYFGQRKILYDVYSWEKLTYMINSGKIKYFISYFNDFNSILVNKYPAIFLPNDRVLFNVQAKNLELPRRRLNVPFANNMKLVDFSCKRLPYGYLLLNYGWEKVGPANDPFMVFVHFEDSKGDFLFGQDHYISNGHVNIAQSGTGLIKESYIIKIPDNALNKKLSTYVGLYSPVTFWRVGVVNTPAKDDRVFLCRF